LHELIENARNGTLKFLTNEVLNGLAWHVSSTAATLALLAFTFAFTLAFLAMRVEVRFLFVLIGIKVGFNFGLN